MTWLDYKEYMRTMTAVPSNPRDDIDIRLIYRRLLSPFSLDVDVSIDGFRCEKLCGRDQEDIRSRFQYHSQWKSLLFKALLLWFLKHLLPSILYHYHHSHIIFVRCFGLTVCPPHTPFQPHPFVSLSIINLTWTWQLHIDYTRRSVNRERRKKKDN